MEVSASAFTLRGAGRPANEDAVLADDALGLYAVCDGLPHGGRGPSPANRALEAIVHHVRRNAPRAADGAAAVVLREAFEAANEVVYEAGRRAGSRLATTCTALWVQGDAATLAHVGTSRLYLLRDERLDLLTDDHNYHHEAVRNGILTPAQALRSPFARRLTRALGMRDSVTVDTLRLPLLDGDRFLLCTDGVYGALDRIDPRRALLGAHAAPAEALVRMAYEVDDRDDAAAVVVTVRADAPEHRSRRTRVGLALDALEHVPLFADLTLRERYTVLDLFRPLSVGPGQPIVRQGELGDNLYVVLDGLVDVRRGTKQVASLGPGSHFGEMALLSRRPRSATVTSRAPTQLLEMRRADFLDLVARDATVGAKILWRLAQMLSLRLDDLYALVPSGDRDTAALSLLSPFEDRGG